jgi:hypothetical protein
MPIQEIKGQLAVLGTDFSQGTDGIFFINSNLSGIGGVNAQTGTSYTILATDKTKLVTLNNSSPIAISLTAPATLGPHFWCYLENLGVGAATITPGGSVTIDGGAYVVLTQNQGIVLFCDGSNFWTMRGVATAGGSGSGGLSSFTVSGTQTYLSGFGSWGAYACTPTVAPGSGHILHLKLSFSRTSTAGGGGIAVVNSSGGGYMVVSQNDGNLVIYGSNGSSYSSLGAAGSGYDDTVGPVLIDIYIAIAPASGAGISICGMFATPHHQYAVMPVGTTNATQADLTGTLTIYFASGGTSQVVNYFGYEIL